MLGLDIREEFFTMRVLRQLEQVAQRSQDCPIPGSVQGRVEWSSELPGLVKGAWQ